MSGTNPRADVAVGLRAGILLTLAAAVAWVSGAPAVFPSLGPSAFVLSTDPPGPSDRTVVGGHAVGVAAGLVAYLGVTAVVAVPSSPLVFDPPWLLVSGVVAVALTTTGMRLGNVVHPPACATTLIVALGLLEPRAALLVVLPAVVSLLAVDRVLTYSFGSF
ncbi:HPP family protein [Halobellus inordinatus]|uniref:HPP family protein n=1 Tax=Halobellus inordinatus TaxID=1126236 RepID=UPI00210D0C4B